MSGGLKASEKKSFTVGLLGNPNCGKTTLFNALTGASRKVANWPGVTVERVEGERTRGDRTIRFIDLPGIYSLDSYTMEEQIAEQCLTGDEIDVIVDVVDASSMERNLYLTFELLDLGKPVVLALNMMDVAEKRGIEIDFLSLSERLGTFAAIPVSGKRRTGLKALLDALERAGREEESRRKERWDRRGKNGRKENGKQIYKKIGRLLETCVTDAGREDPFTVAADRIATHPLWGVPVFWGILALIFFLTFAVGDFFKGYFERGMLLLSGWAGKMLLRAGVGKTVISLLVDGVFAGVGGVLSFLPNLLCLFFSLALLEDSGYMARIAYVMDDIMGTAGLSGKAFLPMILGFGCTVPAVMAARTLKDEADKKRLIGILPFMSCSARMPVYVLFGSAFFGKWAAPVAFSLYLAGTAAALFFAWREEKRRGRRKANPLIMELPDYRIPDGKTVFIYVKEKTLDYLRKAGTIIFLATVFLWVLMNFGKNGLAADMGQSFGGELGKMLAPLFVPAGFGIWQLTVALVCGLFAKEMVVSACMVLLGMENLLSETGIFAFRAFLGQRGFGPLNAYAFLLFVLFYPPCVAAVGVICRETGSLWWTVKRTLLQLLLAYGISVAFFQIGTHFPL